MAEFNRLPDETYQDYFVRLFENKALYKLDCNKIAELLNHENGQNYGESKYRKEYAAFSRGRVYERELIERGVKTRILSISDIHFPFHLPKELLANYIGKIDILQLNGDIVDNQAISKFSKQYRISPMEEIIGARQYLIELINYVQPKKVVCNIGNHDKRFADYISRNIDTDLIELQPDTSLELIFIDGIKHYNKRDKSKVFYEPLKKIFEPEGIQIEFIDDWKVKIGRTWFCHPLAYRSTIMGTADKCKSYLQDVDTEGFDTVCMAHTHKTGDTYKGNIRLFEQGAFAYVEKMNYADGKLVSPQQKGFALICQDSDGNLVQAASKVINLSQT